MNILEVKSLKYIYGKGTPYQHTALEDINISVEKGELIGIIGHTGSGKSTLVQTLNGLIKPDEGQVLLEGRDIWEKPSEMRSVRARVGMVFQYPEHQLFDETVRKDIAFGPRNMGLSESEIEQRVQSASQFIGLKEELLDKSPFELSGGEKRRAAIAGVIAMDPEIIIFDEPTAGLDPKGRDMLLSQVQKYHTQMGKTVLLVSHSMEDIAKIADRVLVMNKSRVEMFDTTENVFSQVDRLKSMGLRVPQVTDIVSRLKKKGFCLSDGILTVEQATDEILKLLSRGERN